MSELVRVGDLEIEQNLAYQRREWRAQRIGWAIMALIIWPCCSASSGRACSIKQRLERAL